MEKLAEKKIERTRTSFQIGEQVIGDGSLTVMAGPCAVEGKKQLLATARSVKEAGATVLRGGAYKPRTSPHSFQGLKEKGLELLKIASRTTGLPVITEVMDPREVELIAEYCDILQIGARNMQNYPLLKEVGQSKKPVLLKRGLSATIKEWIMAAEYIVKPGNDKIILCERGIRSFSDQARFTLDISAIPILKRETSLPVFIDPSHSSGDRDLVPALSRAAVAAGADGLLIEVHHKPEEALCDGPQSLTPDQFYRLMKDLIPLAGFLSQNNYRKKAIL